MNKILEKVQTLLEGGILERVHNGNDFLFGGTEYLYAYKQNDQIHFEIKGFVEPNKTPDERVIDVLKNPDNWNISSQKMSDGFPYPWSFL